MGEVRRLLLRSGREDELETCMVLVICGDATTVSMDPWLMFSQEPLPLLLTGRPEGATAVHSQRQIIPEFNIKQVTYLCLSGRCLAGSERAYVC